MPPTFSVVIPTYNHADYLRVALQSVLDQTFRDFEVIIVNNYSADHTLSVIEELRDERVQVINFRNHGVIGASRNVGIKASAGEYVAFLDSDDKWRANKLEQIARIIEDPHVGLVCHDQILLRDDGVEIHTRYGPRPGFKGTMHEFMLFAYNGPSTSATVVARRHLDEVGCFSEDPRFATVEDYDLWIKLSEVCQFKFVPEVLSEVRERGDGASANIELHLRSGLAVLDQHFQDLRDRNGSYPRLAVRRLYATSYFVAARRCHRRSHFKRTLALYARCLWNYPFLVMAYAGLALLLSDLLLGHHRRQKITKAVWGTSWRWG